ncbi:MAG: hypothetical protein CSA70_08070 [Rhodobacterales bacterium]|nr:MAG: hypothetical protein CSA70_08070 [Rhodobacterales bacterium]
MNNELQSNQGNEKPKPLRRGVRIVLFLSLALNLVVVGLVVGAVASHRDRDRHPPRFDRISGPLIRALSKQDKRFIGREMRNFYRASASKSVTLRAQYDDVLEALRADPFQVDVVQGVMDAQMDQLVGRARLGKSVLLDRLKSMTPQERAAFADRLEEELERPRRDKKRTHGPKDGRDGRRWFD